MADCRRLAGLTGARKQRAATSQLALHSCLYFGTGPPSTGSQKLKAKSSSRVVVHSRAASSDRCIRGLDSGASERSSRLTPVPERQVSHSLKL